MFKKQLVCLISLVCILVLCAPAQNAAKKNERNKLISADATVLAKEQQVIYIDFKDKDSILRFVKAHLKNINEKKVFEYWEQPDLKHSAIVFMKHGFDQNKLPMTNAERELQRLKKEKDTDKYKDKIADLETKIDALKKSRQDTHKKLAEKMKILEKTLGDLISTDEQLENKIDAIETDLAKARTDGKPEHELMRLKRKIKKWEKLFYMNQSQKMEEKEKIKNEIKRLDKEIKNLRDRIVELENVIEHYVLHKEGKKWSPYLMKTKKILLVLLGGKKDLALSDVSIENKRSAFKQSFKDLLTIIEDVLGQVEATYTDETMTCRFVELNPDMIKPPSVVTVKPKSFNKEFDFKIHKKNMFLFRVGVTSALLDKKQFKIEDKLLIELDKDKKKEWKQDLIVMLDFHLPRDLDRFNQLKWWEKLGIFAGVRLSKDPLDKLYLGLSFSVYKNLDIIGGMSWQTEVKSKVNEIGDIKSVQEALDYAERGYSGTKWFFGLSFAPAYIGEILGIK